ncbi:hypothetical protein D3C77_630540 [compost metagenome]
MLDDIDNRRITNDLDHHVGVRLHEAERQRTQHVIHGGTRRVDAQGAGRVLAKLIQLVDGGPDVEQGGRQPFKQALARFGGRHAAGGAVQQPNA